MSDLEKNLLEMRDKNVGRLFQRVARAYSERAVELLHEKGFADITLFHTALISNLDAEGTRITTLADRAGVTKQAMGQLAHELEQKGYIERKKDVSDARASLVCFTELGKDFLRAAFAVKLTIETEYAALLGEKELVELRNQLEKLAGST